MNFRGYKPFSLILLYCFTLFPSFSQLLPHKDYFRPPVDFQVILSANFGEIRSGHFHSGIDIKTQGAEGKNIYAVADGYVSRINISPSGFGKALYITHPDGYVTVYAHLRSFREDIGEYVKSRQYEQKCFALNLFPARNEFPVKKGEIIAWSGNSGSSSGPHLHFEVREEKTQKPVNPLLYNFTVTDNIRPEIRNIFIYDLTGKPGEEKRRIPVIKHNESFLIQHDDAVVHIGSRTGIGVESYDLLNDSPNRCGIYSLHLFLDENQVYSHRLDKFSFSETQYVHSHIDYEESLRSSTVIEKTFLQPNNRMSIYEGVHNMGVIQLDDTLVHMLTLQLTDVHGNLSGLSFPVQMNAVPPPLRQPDAPEYTRIFPYQVSNTYSYGGFSIEIPANSLYDTLYFRYAMTEPAPGMLSPLHHIHDEYTPLHKDIRLSVRADEVAHDLTSKLLLVRVDKDGKYIPVGGSYRNGYLETTTRAFGNYTILMDTVPPLIRINSQSKLYDFTSQEKISFFVTDDLSGIKSYHGYIDGDWVLFEYDEKNDHLYYVFDRKRLPSGKKHFLVLTVIDERQNFSVINKEFYW